MSNKVCEYADITNKINLQNVTTYFQLAKLFNLSDVAKTTYRYIKCCFAMVIETHNFLELDYSLVAKTFSSSQLHIDCELQVFNAGVAWLKHKINNRKKYVKTILQKVRLSLLSGHTLNNLLKTCVLETEKTEYVKQLQDALDRKSNFIVDSSVSSQTRYCDQKMFNITVCGGMHNVTKDVVSNVSQIAESDFKTVKVLPSMIKGRWGAKAVCLKGEIYIFEGDDSFDVTQMSVEKYSPYTESWSHVTDIYDDRDRYCVCSFMDDLFIIGGTKNDKLTDSCMKFNTKDCKWHEVARRSETRCSAACAVFEGTVVVSGGADERSNGSKTVECYDVIDAWSSMAEMITGRFGHSLVVVRNKLFVVGFESDVYEDLYEVYDSTCKKFVTFKGQTISILNFNQAISIGSKIYIFKNDSFISCYDVDKEEWSEHSLDNEIHSDSCVIVKTPIY